MERNYSPSVAEHLDKEAGALIHQYPGLLLTNKHFDYGNGYHGSAYLDPHVLIRHPSLIIRLAQILISRSGSAVRRAEIIAGPWRGGAILAHTLAVLLGSQEEGTERIFVPIDKTGEVELRGRIIIDTLSVRQEYAKLVRDRTVWVVDDVSNTGITLFVASELMSRLGGKVIAVGSALRRSTPVMEPRFPQLYGYTVETQPNFQSRECPLCLGKEPIFRF